MISCSCPPGDVGTIQMCGVFVFAVEIDIDDAEDHPLAIRRDFRGSPTRFSFIMSSKVKGCLAWAKQET